MPVLLSALLIGGVAGLRTMTAPAAVSWAAYLGWLPLGGTWAGFLGHVASPVIFSILAVAELAGDKLPQTPSRKTPLPFAARIVSGAFCGAAIGTPAGILALGAAAGALGAVVGTLAGYAFRRWLTSKLGGGVPAALLEDAIAIGAAAWTVASLI